MIVQLFTPKTSGATTAIFIQLHQDIHNNKIYIQEFWLWRSYKTILSKSWNQFIAKTCHGHDGGNLVKIKYFISKNSFLSTISFSFLLNSFNHKSCKISQNLYKLIQCITKIPIKWICKRAKNHKIEQDPTLYNNDVSKWIWNKR